MDNKTQAVSPVTSPRTSTTAGVFSQVRTAVNDRLDYTVQGHNRVPNLVAQSRAAKPQATVSNDLAATISEYSPQPGLQPARSMRLDVQNTPLQKSDKIIDAIQRYLDIRPRREPTSDPKDEASIHRHPQQIIQSAAQWDQADFYQFSINGMRNQQINPEHRSWAGQMEMTIGNEGSANIGASATRAPSAGRGLTDFSGGVGRLITHDPVEAAQSSMGQMREMQAEPAQYQRTGAPIMTENPYFDPAFAGQNAMRSVRQKLAESLHSAEGTNLVGPVNFTDNPDHSPTNAASSSMGDLQTRRAETSPDPESFLSAGAAIYTDNPDHSPTYAASTTMSDLRAGLEELHHSADEAHLIGPPSFTANPANNPNYAYSYAMGDISIRRNDALHKGSGALAADGQIPDQGYARAMRVINQVDQLRPGAQAYGGWA